MTLVRIGGPAALICAATYIVGFVLLLSVLAPLGYGTGQIDPAAVVAFTAENAGLMIAWHSIIYVLNALALAVLVVALHARLTIVTPAWAETTRAIGLIWAALVLGAGMIANVTVEETVRLSATDPEAAVALWRVLHVVELGLGGGNEIAGGVWILGVSLAAWGARVLPRPVSGLGVLVGASGLLTVLPPLGDSAGAIFGLGAILWFLGTGFALLRGSNPPH